MEKMEVIFSYKEFISHVILCIMLLLTALVSFFVDVWYARSENSEVRLATYYIKLPVYTMLLVATVNICLIILGLSKVTRENLEIMVSNFGHLQIRHISGEILEPVSESSTSSELVTEAPHESIEKLTKQQTQDLVKSAFKERYNMSSTTSVLTSDLAHLKYSDLEDPSQQPSQAMLDVDRSQTQSGMHLNDILVSAFV